ERGTTTFTREQLRRQLARTGSAIVINAEHDWTMFGLRTTLSGLRDTWPGFADRLMAPRFDSTDVAAERDLAIAGLSQRRDSPDSWTERLADSVAFAGHAYSLDPEGTAASMSSMSAATLRAYHRDQFVKSRLLLVIVGNISHEVVDTLVRRT